MENQKGKPSTRAKNKYNSLNYDKIHIIIPKGQKSELSSSAGEAGKSLNGYILNVINEYRLRTKLLNEKTYTIIGGVNGTGKSSFAGVMKSKNEFLGEIIDADKITAENKLFPVEGDRIALLRIAELLDKGTSFTQETAFSNSKIEIIAETAKELGYFVRLFYIGFNTPEEAIKRIYNRIARGGYDIGEVNIQHRFTERWKKIKKVLPYCDEAFFFDNDNGFIEVAEYLNKKFVLKGEAQPDWILELSGYLKRNKI